MKRTPFRRWSTGPVIRSVADEAEILLYDEIGFWGVTAEAFRRELEAVNARTVHLRINSPGGSVFDGLAIYNALREHPAHVITHIDGLAASIASVVALAGDEVRMAEGAFLMIHDPWTITIGNAEQLRKDAELLDKIGGTASSIYQAKTGAESDQITTWMADETWFSGPEAVDAGFADALENVFADEDPVALAAALYDLSIYSHVPDALVARGSGARREPTTRELERALRDAGLSRSEAARLVAARAGLRDAAEPRKAPEQLSADPMVQAVLEQLRTNNNALSRRYEHHG